MAHPCVFLDRDGTLIEDPGYLTDPGAVVLLPDVAAALRRLAEAGYLLVVVSNQSAVARGMLTEAGLARVDAELRRQLGAAGVELAGTYYCPYHPEGSVPAYARDSDDRKPRPGMLLRAAGELEIDLPASWMIGDAPRDVQAGRRAGCRTVLLRPSGRPSGDAGAEEDAEPDFVAADMGQAAEVILRRRPQGRR